MRTRRSYFFFVSLLGLAMLAFMSSLAIRQWAFAGTTTVLVNAADSTSDAGGCGTAPNPCNTIGAGIANADPGDTVQVVPGTYDGEQLTIDKSLTLDGDDTGQCPGTGEAPPVLDGNGAAGPAITIAGGVSNVTIQGFAITDYDGHGVAAINANPINNITVRDNLISDLAGDGIAVGNGGENKHEKWLVRCNLMTDIAGIAIDLTNTENSTLLENTVTAGLNILGNPTNDSQVGIRLASRKLPGAASFEIADFELLDNQLFGPFQRAAIELQALDQENNRTAWLRNVVIRGNEDDSNSRIQDSGGASGHPARGIYINVQGSNASIDDVSVSGTTIDGAADGVDIARLTSGSLTDIEITMNDIRNSIGLTSGVHIQSSTDVTGIFVHCNNIVGNTTEPEPAGFQGYGANNQSGVLNAESNWWGDATGPRHASNPAGEGDRVSNAIDFIPWLTAPFTAECLAGQGVTPTSTPDTTNTPTNTGTPTITGTPPTSTPTATETPSATPTETATTTATETATETATATETSTETPTATATPTVTNTPTATPTSTPTSTLTPSPTLTPPKALGDVNDDGLVNSIDALLILQFNANLITALPNAPSADVDLNTVVGPVDAALILQFVAGLLTQLPPPAAP